MPYSSFPALCFIFQLIGVYRCVWELLLHEFFWWCCSYVQWYVYHDDYLLCVEASNFLLLHCCTIDFVSFCDCVCALAFYISFAFYISNNFLLSCRTVVVSLLLLALLRSPPYTSCAAYATVMYKPFLFSIKTRYWGFVTTTDIIYLGTVGLFSVTQQS